MIQRIATLYPTAQGGFVNLADVTASFVERVKHSYLRNRTEWGYHVSDGSFAPFTCDECAEFETMKDGSRLDGFVWCVFIRVRGSQHVETYSVHKTEPEADAALVAMRAEALRCTVEVRS